MTKSEKTIPPMESLIEALGDETERLTETIVMFQETARVMVFEYLKFQSDEVDIIFAPPEIKYDEEGRGIHLEIGWWLEFKKPKMFMRKMRITKTVVV